MRLGHDVERRLGEPIVVLVDRSGEGVLDGHESPIGLTAVAVANNASKLGVGTISMPGPRSPMAAS